MSDTAKTAEIVNLPIVGPASLVPQQVPIEDRVLERLLNDPNADPERVREALALRKEIYEQRRQERLDAAKEDFFVKLAAAQGEMKTIVANRQGHGYNYADYDKVERDIRPIYTKHGFSVTYNTKACDKADHVIVTAKVTRGLYSEDYETPPLLSDGKGPKGGEASMTKGQAVGAGMTYGQRYLARLIWNLTFKNDVLDNDASGSSGVITAEQVKEIEKLIEESGVDKAKFLAFGKVESIEQIPAHQFASAKKMLEERRAIKLAKEAADKEANKSEPEAEKLVEKAKQQKTAKHGV